MGRNSCRLEMALPAPVQPPNRLGAAPLARLRVQTTGGVGPVQVARRPPGVRAGREAAAAGWGGSGPAASSCSPPAWGSAGRAGRSEVRAPPSLPRPFPGRPRGVRQKRVGGERSGGRGQGSPVLRGAGPAAISTFTLRPGSRSRAGRRGRRPLRPAQRRGRRGAGPLGSQPGPGGTGRALVRGFAVSQPSSWLLSD